MKLPASEDTVRQLAQLLATETATEEIYRDASRGVSDRDLARRLTAIADRHAGQAAELRRQIARLSGASAAQIVPSEGWSKLSEVTGSILTAPGGWKRLRERERLGLQSYRQALDRVDPPAREAFLGSLIPAQFRNVCAWSERNPES